MGFGFGAFFGRFLGILCAMEVYDIVFFDWVLLCHSNFFPHFSPGLKGIVGPQQFGYNKASHLRHLALYLPRQRPGSVALHTPLKNRKA